MACFHPNQLPSPRWDELFPAALLIHPKVMKLPSPRGDELFPYTGDYEIVNDSLPSPRGDELFLVDIRIKLESPMGYRPLAGMNCFRTKRNLERRYS